MTAKLTTREKRLLGLCVGVLVLMASMILVNAFLQKRKAVLTLTAQLETQLRDNQTWLSDKEYWEKHAAWLEQNLPSTESLGRAQGQMLEELQNAALDLQIRVERQTLLEPSTQPAYREVAVNLRLAGDQDTLLRWLATLQSPERFQVIKELEFELNRRSRTPTPKPQAECNLTLARWFKPVATASAPAS